ncbi:MAG: hypothetical protein J0L64_17385 [Acidobacteria bacterium]|nr:hypothetical protein [Acidobacteriota bacterium]
MRPQRLTLLIPLLFTIGLTAADDRTHNSELKRIYQADQKDRETPLGSSDWKTVGPRDAARRARVRQLIDKGEVRTGLDYERAALVFQHGDTNDDILLAHVLAVTAIGMGNGEARWLAAASLDRYLHRLGQPQVFGTQLTSKDVTQPAGWTMEPYNRNLLAPSLLEANCVPDRRDQTERLDAIHRGVDPPAPKHPPCVDAPSGKKRP